VPAAFGPVFVQDSFVYVTDQKNTIHVFDISDPENPIRYQGAIQAGYQHIFLQDSLAYLANPRFLDVVNLKDIENPQTVGRYDTPGNIKSFFFHENLIYIAADYSFIILESQLRNSYYPGDADDDNIVDINDAVCVLNYLFIEGDPPVSMQTADVTCDGRVSLIDVVYLINYFFRGGCAPCDTNCDGDPDC
jgi:hypothetical protein